MNPANGGEEVTFTSTVTVPEILLRLAVAVGFNATFAPTVNVKVTGANGAGFFPVTVTLNTL